MPYLFKPVLRPGPITLWWVFLKQQNEYEPECKEMSSVVTVMDGIIWDTEQINQIMGKTCVGQDKSDNTLYSLHISFE